MADPTPHIPTSTTHKAAGRSDTADPATAPSDEKGCSRAKVTDRTVDADSLLKDVASMFDADFFPQDRVRRARKGLGKVDWNALSYWRQWSEQMHPLADTSGPDTSAIRSRTGLYQATSRQRNIAGARWAPATRLPQDLSKEEHMAEALNLEHPFQLHTRVERDVTFAVEACVRLGPQATGWRTTIFNSIRQLARALAPLDHWALSHRPTRHCAGWAPALTAAFIHILQWSDRSLPRALVEGFQVVGRIPTSGIHRQLSQETREDEDLRASLLGDSAIDFIDKLEHQRHPHPHAADILRSIEEEIDLNLARPPSHERTWIAGMGAVAGGLYQGTWCTKTTKPGQSTTRRPARITSTPIAQKP